MSSKSTKSLNTKKNALNSVESRLLRDTFCCQRRCSAMLLFRLQYKTSVIRHNVNTQKLKTARGDRLSFTPV